MINNLPNVDDSSALEYLRQHPEEELSLWESWVRTVCRWQKIAPPTDAEWQVIKAKWSHGKAPVDSVAELRSIRGSHKPTAE